MVVGFGPAVGMMGLLVRGSWSRHDVRRPLDTTGGARLAIVTSEEWIVAFAGRIDTKPPSEEVVEALLDLARLAAHSTELIAAPLACWLADRSGQTAEPVKLVAEEIDTEQAGK